MSEVTQLKTAIEQAAGPAAGVEKQIIEGAATAAWAKYKYYIIGGVLLLAAAVVAFVVKLV